MTTSAANSSWVIYALLSAASSDRTWRTAMGHIVTDARKRASSHQSVKGLKKMMLADAERASALADAIVKNTYRTLMTRGMKGC